MRLAVVGMVLTISAMLLSAAGATPTGSVVAVESRIESDADRTRLVFTLSRSVTPRVFSLEGPDRLVIDLPTVNFQLPQDAGRRASGLVKAYRFGLFAPGRSRVVVDLMQPALPSRVSVESLPGNVAAELVIELRKVDRAAFGRAVAVSREQAPASAPSTTTPRSGDDRPVVVIDPGHGGIDVGAVGIGNVQEKDLVFAVSQMLRTKLERSGRVRVVMTRDTDVFVALDERVRLGRQANAALFVSIHADSISGASEVRGMTVYTGSDRATDAEAARLAESENRADSVAGVDEPETREEVAGILDDLTKRETRTYSALFARTLVGRMETAGKVNKNPHRSAGFRVLRAPDIPSALVELGYLSSPSDAQLMLTAEWRERTTDMLTSAIIDFLEPRIADKRRSGEDFPGPMRLR
jgi:N-acetylmuramoyl-L-alanine amidase